MTTSVGLAEAPVVEAVVVFAVTDPWTLTVDADIDVFELFEECEARWNSRSEKRFGARRLRTGRPERVLPSCAIGD